MPRKSAAAAAIKPVGIVPQKKLSPPPTLDKSEASLFGEIVAACDASHFTPSDLPLLCRYVAAVRLAELAEQHLRDEGPVIDGRASAWLIAHEKAVRAVVALSLRLRLSPQSRIDPKTAGRNPGVRPSAYDLMREGAL